MSFSGKLTAWLVGALSLVTIVHGAFVYEHERTFRVRDVAEELDLYARIVQSAVQRTQRSSGWDEALSLGMAIEPRDLAFAADHRFLWVNKPAQGPPLDDAPGDVRAMAQGGGDGRTILDSPDGRWRVYRVIRGADGAVAVFVVSHDARDVEAFIRSTALGEVLAVLLAALACAGAVALVNRLQVRPVFNRLIEQARRIDHKGEVEGAEAEDEIALLGEEMSRMERRINEARAALECETEAKLGMAAQLRHADRLATVGRLAAGVAHEFGTPLTVVRGRAKLIVDNEEVPEVGRASARVIVEQADRMARIIRQLLDLARRRGPPQGPCELRPLFDRVVELLAHGAARERVSLVIAPGSDETVWARGDLQQLEQVLLNLVLNAIQALAPGGGGEITLRSGVSEQIKPPEDLGEEPGPHVWFEVEDNGPGIPEDILPVLFEPFVTTKEPGKGTGLGLPLAAGIVRDHGGWVEVSSTPGKGARFRVYLKPFQRKAT